MCLQKHVNAEQYPVEVMQSFFLHHWRLWPNQNTHFNISDHYQYGYNRAARQRQTDT